MNIVYGGSFNPPTKAHCEIMSELIKTFNPDNLIIVPVGDYYNQKHNLVASGVRLEMLNLMVKDKKIVFSDVEIREKSYKGTYHTLKTLQENYADLYFVMGADNVINIKKWINYSQMLKEFNFIIITRDNIDISKILNSFSEEEQSHFHILRINIDISSSQVRQNLEENKDMLCDEVYNYIVKNNLYRNWV